MASLAVAGGRQATAAAVFPADSVRAVPTSPVSLATPADGRVDGYGFAAQVLGVATGDRLPGPAGVTAAPGQSLWVFGLRWNATVTLDPDGVDADVTQIAAAVVSYGQRIVVPVTQAPSPQTAPAAGTTGVSDSGAEYFEASVPVSSDVVLEISSGGYAQGFSLTHMAREGAQPDALYREAGQWETVDQTQASKSLATPFSDEDQEMPSAMLTIDLAEVTLSWFGPQGPSQTASTVSQAWLVPDLTDPTPSGQALGYAEYLTPLSASDLTLTIPGRPAQHPQAFPGGPDAAGGGDGHNGLFPDLYGFQVPVSVDTATLTVSVPSEQVTVAYSGAGNVTVHPGTVTFPIVFPQPQPAAPTPAAASSPAAFAAVANKVGSGHPSGDGSGGFPVLPLVLGLLALGAAAAGTVYWRRRQPTPTAASPPPAAGGPRPWGPPNTGAAYIPPAGADQASPADPDGPAPHPRDTANDSDDRLMEKRFVPPVPPVLPEPAVTVLGPVGVSGWVEPSNRAALTAIVVYLACHADRPVPLERLQWALGADGDSDPEASTLRSNMSRTRRALGPGHLPDATSAGYQLRDVTCDWSLFQDLARRAEDAESEGAACEALDLYGQALALVAGEPFMVTSGYGWVDNEGLRTHVETVISDVARRAARVAAQAGRPELGLWALRQALVANPVDEALAIEAIHLAAATGRPGAVRAEWTRISRQLQARDIQPGPQLTEAFSRHVHHPSR